MPKKIKNNNEKVVTIHSKFFRNLISISEFIKNIEPVTLEIDKLSKEQIKDLSKKINTLLKNSNIKTKDSKKKKTFELDKEQTKKLYKTSTQCNTF